MCVLQPMSAIQPSQPAVINPHFHAFVKKALVAKTEEGIWCLSDKVYRNHCNINKQNLMMNSKIKSFFKFLLP